MKERPIIFSSEMIRAILEKRKSQTRRVIKPQPEINQCLYPGRRFIVGALDGKPSKDGKHWEWDDRGVATIEDIPTEICKVGELPNGEVKGTVIHCPYGKPGDRLWVRETWGIISKDGIQVCNLPLFEYVHYLEIGYELIYRADLEVAFAEHCELPENRTRWRPSTLMPRWASRITLEITNVRVERVQEITGEDAYDEGLRPTPSPMMETLECEYNECRAGFKTLWNSIHKKEHTWEDNPWVWCVEFKKGA